MSARATQNAHWAYVSQSATVRAILVSSHASTNNNLPYMGDGSFVSFVIIIGMLLLPQPRLPPMYAVETIIQNRLKNDDKHCNQMAEKRRTFFLTRRCSNEEILNQSSIVHLFFFRHK